jgi:hypothetical protein
LSPLISILDDRVARVTAMGTRRRSYVHDWLPQSDIEVAIMHTEKDTILRLMTGFTSPSLQGSEHCCRLVGTNGWVEQGRTDSDPGKQWFVGMKDKTDTDWESSEDEPDEARQSGHGGLDYYPVATFVQSVLKDEPSAMDVYQAADTAAPAILAAASAAQGSVCLEIPDFRPDGGRKPGEWPEQAITERNHAS